MTDAAPGGARALHVHRAAWLWAGVLLAGSVLPTMLGQTVAAQPWAPWSRDILFSASILLFALGHDSVTARRPLGTIALVVFGVWQLLFDALWLVVSPGGPDGPIARAVLPLMAAWPYAYLAAGILATVQIARAGVLHGRWRWVPLAGVCVAVGWQILLMAMVSLEPASVPVAVALANLGNTVACIGVGVAAVVLSTMPRERVEAAPAAAFPVED